MINLTINGKIVTAEKEMTVLDAARHAGIFIPTLCHHPKLTSFGGCRLCLVEIEGIPRPVTACTTPAGEGMVVRTTSPRIEELRKTVLELLLSDHPNDCMICERAGDCTLQDMAYYYDISENPYAGERRTYEKRDGNPFIERDMEKCILCARCVKVCHEVQGVTAIDFAYRGFQSKVCPPFEHDLDCEFCGQCVQVCPTGALTGKMWRRLGRQRGVNKVDTTCTYCGTGCNISLYVKGNEIIRVGSDASTWNEGWLCVKGRFAYNFVNSPDRLTKPLIKRKGKFEEVSWDEALDYTASRLRDIVKKNKPDSVGGLSSARCTNEDNYLFQKFIRAVVGTNNVDHCARL
jgi:predicted molibdopterin-dependent oxidoreductase YjgC